jgi:cell division septation protein DedD
MQSFHYVMIAQAAVALFGAFYLTRRMRSFIRAAVVRLMPLKQRISDESFHLQTRFSALVAYLIGLLLTGFFYWGINRLVDSILPGAITQQTITSIDPRPSGPAPILPPPIVVEDPQAVAQRPDISESETAPIREYDMPAPATSNRHFAEVSGTYYIQLYAFISADRALTQQAIYGDRLAYPVSVKKVNGTHGPYKVIVGPFSDRQTAVQLLRREGLEGMVVTEERFR